MIMKKSLFILALLLWNIHSQAQQIGHIETTRSWYYIYDQTGKKTKTLSISIGELQAFSASFFIVKTGSWYHIYNANGNKSKTLSASSVGTILSASGDTFTSQLGSWIYTWTKEGKKINTRAAKQ